MKMSVRYGIIGLGNQGTHYLFDIFEAGKAVDAVVSAVCDINPAKIENVKKRAPKCDPVYFENYICQILYLLSTECPAAGTLT